MAGADLGDERLNRRLRELVDRVAERPEASLPRVLNDAELEAAYRAPEWYGRDRRSRAGLALGGARAPEQGTR